MLLEYQALTIDEALAKDNLTSAEAKRDLLVSYNNLGDVAVQAGHCRGQTSL